MKNRKLINPRKQYTPAKSITCKECGIEVSAYNITQHIKKYHNLDKYIEKYGEFRKSKLNKLKKSKMASNNITCKICNKQFKMRGFAGHLKDTHNISPEDYRKKYGEYRPIELAKIKKSETRDDDRFICKICNEKFWSDFSLGHHLSTIHNMTKIDYVKKYILNNVIPKCACGCGGELRIFSSYPYVGKLIIGHALSGEENPNYGSHRTEESKLKMSKSAIKRIKNNPKFSNTKPETEFKEWLELHNIKYIQQQYTEYGSIDFYLPTEDLYIEVDGVYWHPLIKENLNFNLITNFFGELKRLPIKEKLIRLRTDEYNDLNIYNITSIAELKTLSIFPETTISYYQNLLNKKYLTNYLNNTKDVHNKLIQKSKSLLSLLRIITHKFPIMQNEIFLHEQLLSYNKQNNTDYSLDEFWNNNDILLKAIQDILGLLNNEPSDFSLHQIICRIFN